MSISPILALTPQEHAVLLCFTFYLLNLLVPVVPAAIIYWLFPEGTTRGAARTSKQPAISDSVNTDRPEDPDATVQRVTEQPAGASVEGAMGGWKIKAVGAWAAYVTAFLLGYWAIKTTAVPLITAVGGASVWKIDSDFKFTDENGKEITDTVDKLQVDPPEVKPWGKHATITVFSETLAPPDQIQIKLDGYDWQTVDLSSIKTNAGNKIKVPPITLKRLTPPAASLTLTPLPTGQGPAALTANK
jgi:hypothetical protein